MVANQYLGFALKRELAVMAAAVWLGLGLGAGPAIGESATRALASSSGSGVALAVPVGGETQAKEQRAGSSETASLSPAARFADPPSAARMLKIIHSWPDQPEAQDQLIRTLTTQGFGGVVCNVSFTDYLVSEDKWIAFKRAVRAAQKAGMALWLYDEKGYPSGNAGGLVLQDHPEWEAQGLLIADAESDGGAVALILPPGKPFLIAAFPVKNGNNEMGGKVDLSAQVRDGQLRWELPPGRWHVMAITESRLFEGTHAEMNLWKRIPYLNLLVPEATARFLEVTHQRYAQQLGDNLGRWFVSTFTDEPSLMSLFLKPMPYRALPWAAHLPGEFRKRRGYALEPVVPALIAEAGADGRRWRHDFWQTVGELVSENFFGQIQDWCRPHQILSGGHLLMEENIVTHVPLYGDFFRCIRRLDAPSIDCLTSLPPDVPWYIARLLSSAAELEGKTVVMSETSDHAQRYRPPGDKRPPRAVTEAEIRGTCNRLVVSGVNAITSYYSFADLSNLQLRRLNEWVGRCCTLLRGGHQVADIALLYPTESLWTRFRPARNWANDAPKATQVEAIYRAAADSLFAAQRDFTFVDSRALTEAKANAGALIHKDQRWRVVVLPGADTLPLAAWENLAIFVRSGGVLIALGTLPASSEAEFPSPRVQGLAKELFGKAGDGPATQAHPAGGAGVFLPAGSESLLAVVLNGLLEPDVKVSGSRAPVRATHRHVEGHELYFLINDSPQPWEGDVRLCVNGHGEQWDPATGKVVSLGNIDHLKLSLEAYGGTFLRFPVARQPLRQAGKSGTLPNLGLRSLPEVKPGVGKGEFVQDELVAAPPNTQISRPAWTATGTLTKGQVDTFLFVRLPYPQLLDLSTAECLVIDSWVPSGQRAATALLVIVQAQDGGDFLASTGRSLSASGHDRSFVPMSRFQLAGWSKDADGRLDWKRIKEIRIGWGGYLGTEGQKVQFTLAVPQMAELAPSAAK